VVSGAQSGGFKSVVAGTTDIMMTHLQFYGNMSGFSDSVDPQTHRTNDFDSAIKWGVLRMWAINGTIPGDPNSASVFMFDTANQHVYEWMTQKRWLSNDTPNYDLGIRGQKYQFPPQYHP
jgi:hypothetical protein